MRRAELIGLLAVVLVGTLALALIGARDDRTLAFTLGVTAQAPAVVLRPGATVCQEPIPVAEAFDRVELQVGTFARPGQELDVVVREPGGGGGELARGRLERGYGDVTRQTVAVGEVSQSGRVAVCVRNNGTRRVALYGAADGASRVSTALLDGEPTGTDVDLVFRARDATSTLALMPAILERMSLFRGGWIGAWLYWLLLVAVVIGVPVLLGRALVAAARAGETAPRDQRGDQATRR